MADLGTLRPEVRDALASIQGEADCRCSEPYKSRGMKDPQCNHDLQDSVDVIRAELLRLADECAMIPRAQLLANFAAANERAEKAEAELAALKARIADAPVYEIPLSKPKSEDGWARVIESVKNERSVRGKRVRLVVEE